jgi:hypothetical protein
LEKALKVVSGWSVWLVPFLVQNIGWFVGGFCFIAGSIFLVAYTGGFANACAVFFVLLAYSLLLLWGGYQLRSKRPELHLSSGVLITLSTLLVPLCLASAMRMILAADSALTGSVAALVSVGYSCAAYWAVTLALGMADRSLQGRHTTLFLALSAAQWAVPALARWPNWPLLAVLHLGLLGLLGHALAQFTGGWLHSLFVEQRKTAYRAAGTLVYAALVTFIHLTFGAGDISLPEGYFGPFLMALAGLLFQVDAELKHWSDRDVRLTRFSFALYALSVCALALAFGEVGAAAVTLMLGLGIYASVIWRYLTFPPLALFLVCAFWLYALLALRHFDAHWHLLLSLPGLAGLHTLARRALGRRSAYLAGLTLLCLAVALAGLLVWSLVHAEPGWVALASALATIALVHELARLFPKTLLEPLPLLAQSRWVSRGREIYLLALLYGVALAYAPRLLAGPVQPAYGLILLACAWTWLGLSARRAPVRAEAWLNCAMSALSLDLVLAFNAPFPIPFAALAFCGGVWAWQSLMLYERSLFYLALLAWGLTAAAVKLAYLPEHGSGGAGFWLAFLLCLSAGWLESRTAETESWRREQKALGLLDEPPPLTLLGRFRVGDNAVCGIGELLCPPLRQTAALLWLLGLGLWLARLAGHRTGLVWIAAALPGMFAAIALAGHFRIAHWPIAPMSLGLLALLAVLDHAGFSESALCVAALLYAALVWRGAVALFAYPASLKWAQALKLDLGLDENRPGLEQDVHYTGFVVTLAGMVAVPLSPNPGSASAAFALAVGIGFFHAAGWRYRSVFHSYLVLALAVIAALLAYRLGLPEGVALQESGGAALLLAALALACWGLARFLMLHLQSPNRGGRGSKAALNPLALWERARVGEPTTADAYGFNASLYRKPLHRTALLLGWAGALLTLAQFLDGGWALDASAIAALGLSALAIRLSNRRLAYAGMNPCADLAGAVAALWLEFWLRHGPARFDPWADEVWITLALLASAFSIRLASRWQIRHWPPMPMLLALAALLGVLRQYGFDAPALCLSALLYSWLAWRAGLAVFAHPACEKLAVPFKLELGLDSAAGRAILARDIHGTGFILSLLGFAAVLAEAGHLPAAVPAFALLLIAGFFYDAGFYYRSTAHSYCVLALGVIAMLLACQRSLPAGTVFAQTGGGVSLALLGLAYWGLAQCLAVGADNSEQGFGLSLYRKPLQAMGALLGWIALALALARSAGHGWIPDAAGIATLGLAALGLTLSNRRLRWPLQDLAAVLLAALGVLWLEAWLLHRGQRFDPWTDPSGDIWISLALLNFALAVLGSKVQDQAWRATLAEAVQCLGGLLGLRVFVPFALLRLPALLGLTAGAGDVRLAEAALPLLVGLMLPWTPGRGWLPTHASIAAWLCAALSAYLWLGAGLFHPPLMFGLCGAGLLGVAAVIRRRPAGRGLEKALESWAFVCLVCLVAALGLLFRFVFAAPAETLLTLVLATGLSVLLAYRRESAGLLYLAAALAVAVLHGWLWVLLRPASPFPLLPWYALQWAVLLWRWPSRRQLADGWLGEAQRCAWACRDGVVALLVGELALHSVVWALAAGEYSGFAHFAALTAASMLLALEARDLRGGYDSPKVYALAALAFAIAAYVRLLLLGWREPGLWDAAALILATFAATFLHRLTLSTPLLRIATGLPLLALLTVRWELASASGSATLLALGGVYVWLSQAMGKRLPVYLGLLFANIGVYLWAPYVAQQANLLQVYVLPAAVSVLLMLHLHKRELKPETLNASRLAATATLYGCATLDVFLRPEFGVFLLALGLSLASLLAGVALRVRAFVYSGLCFLVLNIAGQLGQLYPEGRLARAIVLMGLGSVITVAMIVFQLKREAALKKIRMIRADLAGWE